MEINIIFLIIGLICFGLFIHSLFRTKPDIEKIQLQNNLDSALQKLELLRNSSINPTDFVHRSIYFSTISEKDANIELLVNRIKELMAMVEETTKKNEELFSKQKSEQVRLGKIAEQLVPFLENFKHNPKDLRPMFNPIDYICFEEDKITFVEVKSGDSALSPKQKNIQKLVEEGKVYFEVYRVRE
jgi:predicted Holliday junction resolvase-like endonuclease